MISQTLVALLALVIALAVDMYVNSHPVEHAHLVSVLVAIPSFLAVGLVLFDNSFSAFLLWLVQDPIPCSVVLLALATLPTVCGLLIDTPVAFWLYSRRTGLRMREIRKLSPDERCAIAEYGDLHSTAFNSGRYLPKPKFVLYSLFCNITGVSCTVLLIALISVIPDMHNYVLDSEAWVNILELCLSFSIFTTLLHLYQEQTKDRPGQIDLTVENPDMFRLTRMHTLANSIFLILHVALCLGLVILVFFFGLNHLHECEDFASLVCLSLVAIAAVMFMWFSSASPLASDFDAECGGLWKVGPFILAGAYVVLVLFLFNLPSVNWWLVVGTVALMVVMRVAIKPLKSGFLAVVPVVMLVLTIVGVLMAYA